MASISMVPNRPVADSAYDGEETPHRRRARRTIDRKASATLELIDPDK